jgi:FMN-dependent NADH-azoreductase
MPTLLRLDTSPRVQGSHSRNVGDHLEKKWLEKHSEYTVVRRDLGVNPPFIPLDETIKGHFAAARRELTPEEHEALKVSDELTEEYINSDVLLVTVPMYNFGPPASYKAWMDHIVRKNVFFGQDEKAELVPLLSPEKRIFITAAYGIPFTGSPLAHLDTMKTNMTAVFEVCGIPADRIHYISAEGTSFVELKQLCKDQAKQKIDELLATID